MINRDRVIVHLRLWRSQEAGCELGPPSAATLPRGCVLGTGFVLPGLLVPYSFYPERFLRCLMIWVSFPRKLICSKALRGGSSVSQGKVASPPHPLPK